MPTNIEIKARVRDVSRLRAAVEPLCDGPVEILDQEDTFFATTKGRLKLRVLGGQHGELIHYHRENAAGPKPSNYAIAPTSDPVALKAILTATLGAVGVVTKRRRLYLVGQTRVHLDEVEGLGAFLELEVVLRPGQPEEEGLAIARGLMAKLGIGEDELVKGAYIDLLRGGPPVG